MPSDVAVTMPVSREGEIALSEDVHRLPPELVMSLYAHLDCMRAFFFGGELPENRVKPSALRIVLSFEVRNRRNLGHHVLKRDSLGVRWDVNLNPVHFHRPLYQVLASLLHELAHTWQYERGMAAKAPHHNREFVEMCERLGIPTNCKGLDRGVRHGSPFEDYCRTHGVPFPAEPGEDGEPEAPPPLLPEPVKPKGSRLRKWICACEAPVPVRVARSDFDATCNRCGKPYRPV